MSSEAQAAANSLGDSCMKEVRSSHYLIRGSEDSDKVGARLWNLDAIRNDWQKSSDSSGDSCSGKILDQALKDQSEYWAYIGKKYGCKDANGSTDADSPCGKFVGNQAYLGMMKAVRTADRSIGGASCVRQASPAAAVAKTAKDAAPIVAAALGQSDEHSCDKVPANQRRSKSDGYTLNPFKVDFAMMGSSCWKGIKDQLMAEWKGVTAIASAWYKAGFFTGIANAMRAFAEDPVGRIWEAFTATIRYYTEDFDDFRCLSNAAKVDRVCKSGTKVVVAYLTGKALNVTGAAAGRLAKATGKAVADTSVGKAAINAAEVGKEKLAQSAVGRGAKWAVAKSDAAYDKVAGGVNAVKRGIKSGASAILSRGKNGAKAAASATETATSQAAQDAAKVSAQNAERSAGNSRKSAANDDSYDRPAASKDLADDYNRALSGQNNVPARDIADDYHRAMSGQDFVSAENLPEQIVPPEARAKPTKWDRVKSGWELTKKGAGAVKRGARNSIIGDQLEYHGKVDSTEFQDEVAKVKAEAAAERKQADEEWKKNHPNGEEPTWTPPPPEENDSDKKSQLSDQPSGQRPVGAYIINHTTRTPKAPPSSGGKDAPKPAADPADAVQVDP